MFFLAVREKGKQPLNSTASKKMKIIRLEQVKNQTSGASLVQGNTVREASPTQQRESDEMEVKDCRLTKEESARKINENEEHKMEAGDDSRRMTEEQQRVEDERKRREAEERVREQERQRMEDERKRREAEERKKIKAKWKEELKRREMKVAELEGKIRSCR